jgi:hypothetical protein
MLLPGGGGGGGVTPNTIYNWNDAVGNNYNLLIYQASGGGRSLITSGRFELTIVFTNGGIIFSQGAAVEGANDIVSLTPEYLGSPSFNITITASGDNASVSINAGQIINHSEGTFNVSSAITAATAAVQQNSATRTFTQYMGTIPSFNGNGTIITIDPPSGRRYNLGTISNGNISLNLNNVPIRLLSLYDIVNSGGSTINVNPNVRGMTIGNLMVIKPGDTSDFKRYFLLRVDTTFSEFLYVDRATAVRGTSMFQNNFGYNIEMEWDVVLRQGLNTISTSINSINDNNYTVRVLNSNQVAPWSILSNYQAYTYTLSGNTMAMSYLDSLYPLSPLTLSSGNIANFPVGTWSDADGYMYYIFNSNGTVVDGYGGQRQYRVVRNNSTSGTIYFFL